MPTGQRCATFSSPSSVKKKGSWQSFSKLLGNFSTTKQRSLHQLLDILLVVQKAASRGQTVANGALFSGQALHGLSRIYFAAFHRCNCFVTAADLRDKVDVK